MVNIEVGPRNMEEDGHINLVFYGQHEDVWFEDPFVKKIVKQIDKSDVISQYLIISPVLGPISYEKLSGGVKTLIMLYKKPELKMWATSCGDNCMSLLFQIGKMQDITVKFSHIPDEIPDDAVARFTDTNEVVEGGRKVTNAILDRITEMKRREAYKYEWLF